MSRIILIVLMSVLSACGGSGSSGEGGNVTGAGGDTGGGGVSPVLNRTPVAELTAGSPRTGRAVTLDASASTDPDLDTLAYAWTLVSKPSDSLVVMTDTRAQTNSIVPDVDGEYQVRVSVRDPGGRTSHKTLTLNAQADTNLAPVIRSFTSERGSLEVGETLGFNWTIVDPNRSEVSCRFDPTGSGAAIDVPGCAMTPIVSHTYDIPGVYQPRLTVTDSEGLSVSSILGNVTVLGDISLTIVSPAAGAQLSDAALPITATVSSDFEVSSVTARVVSRTTPLVYSASAICNRGSCSGGLAGTLNLSGLSAGEYVLEVSVEDVQGSRAYFYRAIRYGAFSPPSADGDAPVIGSFRAKATQVFAGSPVSFYWLVSDPQGGAVSCTLDPTGSGPQVSIPNCLTTVSSSYTFATAGTFRPRLVATDAEGKTATADLGLTVSSDPSATLLSPATGAVVGSTLSVSATVTSSIEVASVVARVGDQQTKLAYSVTAVCGRFGCSPGFTGTLDLGSLTRGAQVLELAVTNVQGRTVSLFRDIVYDRAPGLTVTSPENESLATPQVTLEAACRDDDAPCSLEAAVNDTRVASGNGSLSQVLNLAAFDGQAVTLTVTATDSRNQKTTATRTVYVEASPALNVLATLPGRILDVNENRVLVATAEDNGEQAWVHDVSDGTSLSVGLPVGKNVGRSFLSETGAVLTTQDVGGTVLSARILDFNGGTLYDLAFPNSAQSLVVKGEWAMWSQAETLIRRHLPTRVNTVVSTQAGNWQNDLSIDGKAVWWGSAAAAYQVFWNQGSTQQITQDTFWNTYVLTDGTQVAYRKHTRCCANQTYAITLFDGSSEITLRPASAAEPAPGRDYQVSDGWVAYTAFGNLGQKHVWTRSPTGILSQRTAFGRDSTIDALGLQGEVMVLSGGRRYLSKPGQALVEVGSSLGRAYPTGTGWRVATGRGLFEVAL